MAKVRWGLISVRFLEVRSVLVYGKINQGQVSRLLYRGCPHFGGSIIRGFTVFPPGASTKIATEKLLKISAPIKLYLPQNGTKLHCSLPGGFMQLTYESNYAYSCLSMPTVNY